MKKLLLLVCFMLMFPLVCYAEYFCTQRGNTDIFVVRDNYKMVLFDSGTDSYIEFQRIVNYDDKDHMLVHILTNREYSKVDVVVPKQNIKFALEEVKIDNDFIISENRVSKWFKYNPTDWAQIMNGENGFAFVNLVFHDNNGETFKKEDRRINIQQVLDIANYSHTQLQEQKQLSLKNIMSFNYHSDELYYKQPYFTVFFAGKTYEEVKERFCYNLNVHKKNGEIDYNYFICDYAQDDVRKLLGYKTLEYRGQAYGRNFIWFVENDKGTYLNYVPVLSVRNNNGYPSLRTFKENNSTTIYHTFDTIKYTYQELYGLPLYGFELKKYKPYDFNNIRIDKVINTDLAAILAKKTGGNAEKNKYRITAVNDIPTKNMNGAEYDWYTAYNNKSSEVKLTFMNTDTKIETSLVIRPVVVLLGNNNIDYKSINQKNDDAIRERMSPLDFCIFTYPSDDIFDPYTSSAENIVSY